MEFVFVGLLLNVDALIWQAAKYHHHGSANEENRAGTFSKGFPHRRWKQCLLGGGAAISKGLVELEGHF